MSARVCSNGLLARSCNRDILEIVFKNKDDCVIRIYGFLGKEMTSISAKADKHGGGDQRESDLLTSIKDKCYNLIDERGDHDTSNKLNAQNVTKELIAKESGRGMTQSDSESATQSSYTLSIVSTGDNRDDDSKMKSTESSDSEMILIDEGNYRVICTLNIYHKHVKDKGIKDLSWYTHTLFKCYS